MGCHVVTYVSKLCRQPHLWLERRWSPTCKVPYSREGRCIPCQKVSLDVHVRKKSHSQSLYTAFVACLKNPVKMIDCSKCKEWFHVGVCVNVNGCALKDCTKWTCPSCHFWFEHTQILHTTIPYIFHTIPKSFFVSALECWRRRYVGTFSHAQAMLTSYT